ncbi:putative anthocyanidin reductase isoform X1 [Cucumis melo]|uniref:Anthocyanidin reductase isoform X1 n=1 Tax=Cucumis melo TaxID=3656 RepID=A0ABM3KY47_CUCME|nr:putative anthocyanidin reductase isoform X1 [Cucumis melo]
MEEKEEEEEEEEDFVSKELGPKTYCVTGATGFIGSWLVNLLLLNGYKVHATARDPAKFLKLLSSWTVTDRLRLFKADLREEGSFDEAVKGCDGVFHVAASMIFNVDQQDNIEEYVRKNVIDPEIKGTISLLKSCLKSESVKRVVLTSTISTLTGKDADGERRRLVDESCQTSVDQVWKNKPSGWVYSLLKRLSEDAAFNFASENSIDIVSVITSTVSGPFLTSYIPSSIRVFTAPITGDSDFLRILSNVNERMGSVAVVHTNDICRAHIFLMEHENAKGRYLCCVESCALSELVKRLSRHCAVNFQRSVDEKKNWMPSEVSNKKLKDLGFRFEHGIDDIINETIDACVECGFISRRFQF